MPKKIKDRLESIPSDITSLEYIDEPTVKEEPTSPKDVEMSSVIVNPAPICHKQHTDLVTEPVKDKGKGKEIIMDMSEDFTSNKDSDVTYHTAPSTLSPKVQQFMKGVTPPNTREELLDFMDITKKNLTRQDQIEFHKELDKKGYDARSAYLEVMLNGLFTEAINPELHQGHYHLIKDVYNNFNNPLEKFEDQVESVEKDKMLFAILPYELYGDLLIHWLVTRKYIKQAIKVPSDSSMEKVTWSYLNTLFDHRFNDTLSENDFLHCIRGLHGILEKDVQGKFDIDNFGKEGISTSIHAPKTVKKIVEKIVYVEKTADGNSVQATPTPTSEPSLLQQRRLKNKSSMKSSSYDKTEVKNILSMVSQLSDKLDIPITEAFNKAEEILSITQSTGCTSSRSRSRSRGRQSQQTSVPQQPWHTANDPQKITDLAMTIKVLLDTKPKVLKKRQAAPVTKKSDYLSDPGLPMPTDEYNILMAKKSSTSGSQPDRVRWAPMPQIARIDEIPEKMPELQYLLASLESQIAKEQERNKNCSHPPPTDNSLLPYEEVYTAESFEKRSVQPTPLSVPTSELSSYAAAAKRYYEKLPTLEWMEVRRKKAQAAV
ncbi:hypothetical protein AX15_005406 [Amanita polypyramis BW_CC]|nr:hypothetical protein AX15_005406 [Amanita polypyramis BW_CC]